jgi:hypothetical protein
VCGSSNQEGNGFAECECFAQRDVVHGARSRLTSTDRGHAAGIVERWSVEWWKWIADSRYGNLIAGKNLECSAIGWSAFEHQSVETRFGDGGTKRPIGRGQTCIVFRGEEILQNHLVAATIDAYDSSGKFAWSCNITPNGEESAIAGK